MTCRATLRLAQANLRAGTMLTIDVLQAEDAVAAAERRKNVAQGASPGTTGPADVSPGGA